MYKRQGTNASKHKENETRIEKGGEAAPRFRGRVEFTGKSRSASPALLRSVTQKASSDVTSGLQHNLFGENVGESRSLKAKCHNKNKLVTWCRKLHLVENTHLYKAGF